MHGMRKTMMRSQNKLSLLFLSLLWVFSTASAQNSESGMDSIPSGWMRMEVRVQDSVFHNATELRAELLETGDTLYTSWGKPIVFQVPQDTIWGLCITSSMQERCYEVIYTGGKSSFAFDVGGDSLQIQYADTFDQPRTGFSAGATQANASSGTGDSLSAVSNLAGEDTLDIDGLLNTRTERTQLKKIVLQLRRRPRRELGKSVISTKRMKRMPTLAEADVIRTIQTLPGVVASSDFSTKIYVRGGGSDQNLFLLDDAVVFSPVHFFGLFSTFLVEGIDEVEFYKGGFPTEYGNRLSSVVDITSREGGSDTADAWFDKSSLKISTFASQAHTEGHQGKVSWLAAGRATYIKTVLDAMKAAGAIDFSFDYFFYDLQGNVKYEHDQNQWFQFSWYAGEDRLNFSPLSISWGNVVLPFNWFWRFHDDWHTQVSLAYTAFEQKSSIENLFSTYNDIVTFSYKQSLTWQGLKDHKITMGVNAEHTEITFSQELDILDAAGTKDTPDFNLYSLFLQDVWTLGDWQLSPGVRVNYQDLAEHVGAEPRLSVKYKLDPKSEINLHAGYYLQYINSIIFQDQENLNEFYYPATQAQFRDVPPSNSILLSAGYSREKILDMFNLTVEGYYKTLDDLLVWAQGEMDERYENLDNEQLANYFKTGEGYSFGYEVLIRKDEGKIFGGAGWSHGFSAFKEEFETEAYYPNWYQPYSLKADMGINWKGDDGIWQYKKEKKGRYFRSSMQLTWNAGLPYTEYIGYHTTHDIDQSNLISAGGPAVENAMGTVERQGDRNGSFYPNYFRVDVKPVDIGREGKWNFSWTILNITGHENVFMVYYDSNFNPPKKTTIYQFPFFPVLLSYEYYF